MEHEKRVPLAIACEMLSRGITTEDVLCAPPLPIEIDLSMLCDTVTIQAGKIADLEREISIERKRHDMDNVRAERKAKAMRSRIHELTNDIKVKNKAISYYRSANISLTEVQVFSGWGMNLLRGFNHVTGLGTLYGKIVEQLPKYRKKIADSK